MDSECINIIALLHLIPVSIVCEISGKPYKLTAYADYSKNTSGDFTPTSETTEILGGDIELFFNLVRKFQEDRVKKIMQEYELNNPPSQANPEHIKNGE